MSKQIWKAQANINFCLFFSVALLTVAFVQKGPKYNWFYKMSGSHLSESNLFWILMHFDANIIFIFI